MQLKIFKTLWGYTGGYEDAIRQARENGFDGLEGPAPVNSQQTMILAQLLEEHSMEYIAEIATAGSYVPDRKATVSDHIEDLETKLASLTALKPLFVTCLGGCDAWSIEQSLDFFKSAMELADSYKQLISFETHRGRSLFNPWVTAKITGLLPDIKITCDFSHWYVVCEGFQASEEEIIYNLFPYVQHIHCRIGYEQGPQVPDPRSPLYADYLQQHIGWWREIWNQHVACGRQYTTATPEFGPDGYDYRDPDSGKTLIEPVLLNNWMAANLRDEFSRLPGQESLQVTLKLP